MYKGFKNIFLGLFCLFCFAIFIHCKSKKALSNNHENKTFKTNLSTQQKTAFGNFFIDGCAARLKGNHNEAKKLFEESLKIDPQNAAVHYELAMIYKMLGSPSEALLNAKLCANVDQKNEWYQILLAECFVANKQYPQAIKVRENLVKNFPKKNEFKEELAIEYSLIGENEKALKIYNELETKLGPNENIMLNKVRILKNTKNLKAAEQELIQLLNTDKNQIRYYNYLAEFYAETHNIEQSKQIYDKILVIEPNNPSIHLALHDYYVLKGNQEEAYQNLIKAIENPQLDVVTKAQVIEDYYLAAEHGNRKSFDEGLSLAIIAINNHPSSTALNALCGDFYRLDRKLKEASYYYFKAAQGEKNNYKIWQNLLICDNEMLNFDSLERHSQAAIEILPNQPVFYLFNGIANTALKNYNKAKLSLKDGLDLCVGNKRLMIDFLSAEGDNYYQSNDFINSDNSFDEALKLDSDNTYILNNYAYYLSIRNFNLELAEKLSRRANELKPNNANYMDTYAWIFFKQKKYPQAFDWLTNALKLSQSYNIVEHYGDVLFEMNRLDEALLQWSKSKDLGNKSDILLKKIKDKKRYD